MTRIIEHLELVYEKDKKIKFKNYIPGIIVEIHLLKNEYKLAL